MLDIAIVENANVVSFEGVHERIEEGRPMHEARRRENDIEQGSRGHHLLLDRLHADGSFGLPLATTVLGAATKVASL